MSAAIISRPKETAARWRILQFLLLQTARIQTENVVMTWVSSSVLRFLRLSDSTACHALHGTLILLVNYNSLLKANMWEDLMYDSAGGSN